MFVGRPLASSISYYNDADYGRLRRGLEVSVDGRDGTEEFERLDEEFQRFTRRYGPLFGGWAAHDRGEQFLQGLLVGRSERQNSSVKRSNSTGFMPIRPQ